MIVEILITLLIIFLVYASCNIRSNIYLKVFCKKQTEDKIVAITFDDGPDPVQTPKVLQVLKEQQIPACFFCIGHKVEKNEELIRQIINEGHLIGNHSFTHTNHFPLYSLSRMKKRLASLPVCIRTSNFAENQVIPPTVWSHESYYSKSCPHIGIHSCWLEYQNTRYTATFQREGFEAYSEKVTPRFYYPSTRSDAGQ